MEQFDDSLLLRRYYPSSEQFLLSNVHPNDLYDYLFHGFALVSICGVEKYVSYCASKPTLLISRTDEIDKIMQQKVSDRSNHSMLIRLIVKIKLIQVHTGDNEDGWNKIKKLLEMPEFQGTLSDFDVTVHTMIKRMFPDFK